MKKYALFLGCNIPARVFQYEASARLVLKELGIELVDIEEFSCCGPVPLRSLSFDLFLSAGARNLGLAEAQGLDVMCLCSGCFSTLSDVNHHLKQVADRVNDDMTLTSLDFLARIVASNTGYSGCFDTLAINAAGCWLRLTSNSCPFLDPQGLVDRLPGTIVFPLIVVIRNATWRRVLPGNIGPLAARSVQIKYPI